MGCNFNDKCDCDNKWNKLMYNIYSKDLQYVVDNINVTMVTEENENYEIKNVNKNKCYNEKNNRIN